MAAPLFVDLICLTRTYMAAPLFVGLICLTCYVFYQPVEYVLGSLGSCQEITYKVG
jgi:hypothetical protein